MSAVTSEIAMENPEVITAQEDTERVDDSPEAVAERMEDLLRRTFLGAIRWKFDKSTPFPIDAGQFYANVVLKNLPAGEKLEMKKTKFKKFSTFLRQINESETNWIVDVKSKNGIDVIANINFEHPDVQTAELVEDRSEVTGGQSATRTGPRISECFSVTKAVLPLFRPANIRQGDVLQQNQIRDFLVDYSQKNSLLEGNNRIRLDDTLQSVVQHFLPDAFPINDIVQKIAALCTKAVLIRLPDGSHKVRRDKLPMIELKVEKRSGNKLVTLINNSSVFGIDSKALCHKVQTSMGTGTTLIQTANNCEGAQILVQGNQVNFIGDQLVNFCGIQKKFIKGLELGVKEKKKKK